MIKDNDKKIHLSLTRDIKELDVFRKNFNIFLEDLNLRQELAAQLELTIYEVLINIIEHNKQIPGENHIELDCLVSDNNFTCEIEYIGEEFDIRNKKLPDINDHFASGHNRGLGLYIIRTIMDKIDYSFDSGKNRLKLAKKI